MSNRKSFRTIANNLPEGEYKKIFSLLGDKEKKDEEFVADSAVEAISLSESDIESIRNSQYSIVKGNFVRDGVDFKSVSDVKKDMVSVLPRVMDSMKNKGTDVKLVLDAIKSGKGLSNNQVYDGFYNALTGTGVTGFDPSSFNSAFTPISMSPNEVTSYYCSGGLPSVIIDKKVKGALLNGYNFSSINEKSGLTEKERLELKEYACKLGFEKFIEKTDRDGLIYGGSFLYPVFKDDDPTTFDMPVPELVKSGIIKKDCIDYFVEADRWNSIMIPNYNIGAKDYLYPDTYMIPLAGVRVSNQRMAIVRPIELPYWGALRQLGWGRSDFEGYIRSLLAYNVLVSAIPIMAQQMSLLVHIIPLDGIIAQNGPASAEQFVQANNAKMRAWSMLNPMTVNSYGELKAIDRSFADFDKLNMALRQDVAANSGIPESVLFHTQATGFANSSDDLVYKQSETIRNINNSVIPAYKNIVKLLIASLWGPDSDQFKKADTVRLSFDAPDVIPSSDRASMLEKFSSSINMFKAAGINTHDAVIIAQKFMPEISLSEEIIGRLDSENPIDGVNKAQNPAGNSANPAKLGYKEEKDKKIEGLSKEGKR